MADKTGKTWMTAGETDDPNAVIESFEAAVGITKGSPVYLSADDKVSPSPGGDDCHRHSNQNRYWQRKCVLC